MKRLILVAVLLCVTVVFAANHPIEWDAPITNADGTPLTDLAGYKIYYGTIDPITKDNATGNIDVGNVVTYDTLSLPEDGRTWQVAVTAYDNTGNESDFSNVISMTTQDTLPPSAPTGCSWR